MPNELEILVEESYTNPEDILFNSYDIYKKIKDLVLVDEYGAFRELDKEHWNQLDDLATEGLNRSSKNWGALLSKVASFQEEESTEQVDLEGLIHELKIEIQDIREQYETVWKAKDSLALSLERVLAELTHFSIPEQRRSPGAVDFTMPQEGVNFWVEALKATIGLRSRSLLTQFLVAYNQKYTRSQVLFNKIVKLSQEAEVESDPNLKEAKETTIKRLKAILLGVEEFEAEKWLISPVQEEVKAFEQAVEEYQRKIYKKAKQEQQTLEFTQLLEEFLEWLIEQLPNFARLQVKINFLQQLLYLQGTKAATNRIGRIAAEAGDINREALASFSATMVLRIHALGVPLSGSSATLFHFPASYKFHRAMPDGKLTKVAELSEQAADKLIEIRGFVKKIEVFRDSHNKLISRLILEEAKAGELFAAEAIFLHLKHEGIALGAFCHIQGTVRETVAWEGATIPKVLIDKLAIKTKLIQQSWRTAFLDLSSPYYERWPNGLNIKFSLSPHLLGSEPTHSKLGGADLGMKPLVN
jgi:hypothetical protein